MGKNLSKKKGTKEEMKELFVLETRVFVDSQDGVPSEFLD